MVTLIRIGRGVDWTSCSLLSDSVDPHKQRDFRASFFGSGPAAAHSHQLKSLELSGENQSRRDPAKVAQYEVLGKSF
jgi:hypothetical protein